MKRPNTLLEAYRLIDELQAEISQTRIAARLNANQIRRANDIANK
jgi:hypothetical protein